MGLEVYWLQLAEDKLNDIYSHYRVKAGKKVAQKLINGIVDATLGLDEHPEMGQIETSLEEREQQFRYLVFKNYKIIYRVNQELKVVEIANVFDVRQDPQRMEETE